jgi:hypothetical protein
MSKRQEFAWIIIRHRFKMIPRWARPWRRDSAGQILAELVSIVRVMPIALWDGKFLPETEITRRAIRNSQRILQAKMEQIRKERDEQNAVV